MAIENGIIAANRICILKGVADTKVLDEQDSRLLAGKNVAAEVGFALNQLDLRAVEPFQGFFATMNLHAVQHQLLETRIESDPEAAGVLHAGFILHQQNDAGKTVFMFGKPLTFVEQVASAF